MNKIPEFETDRLYLRGVTLEDSESYEKNFAHYEVIQHLSHHVPWPYPTGAVRSFLEALVMPELGKSRWLWVIFLKDKRDEVIGCVDLWRKGSPENRGFWLAKEHWGKGLMTEAVNPVIDYAFNELGFEKLIFANALGNERSRRIKEKTGSTYIENRPAQFVNPDYKEHEIWELTKKNWIKFKEPKMEFGQLHHIEYYVNDLSSSNKFWSWFMPFMGYVEYQKWDSGISWRHASGTYIVFVQVEPNFLDLHNNRQGNGLNHIALFGKDANHFNELQSELKKRQIKILILKEDYICFEDPNNFAIEVYLP